MPATRATMFLLALLAGVLVCAPAFGYSNEVTPDPGLECIDCHGTTDVSTDPEAGRSGPHGGYLSTTNKCATCHSVHAAKGPLLLPAATIKATCETCHDGTGGTGVYGAVEAAGQTVGSGHSIDLTSIVPGGDAATGGESVAVFGGVGGALTCSDCHSPHGTDVVEPFTGDRARTADDLTVTSSRLLKQQPTTGTARVTEYGSDWCASCHAGRLSSSEVHTHPVDSSATQAAPYTYSNLPVVDGPNSSVTVLGTLGHNNFGYVMPDPRTQLQEGHAPICQQCHEDARNVGDQPAYRGQIDDTAQPSELFSPTNPAFGSFPHESPNPGLLVEEYDDLCLNCHTR